MLALFLSLSNRSAILPLRILADESGLLYPGRASAFYHCGERHTPRAMFV
jgi:hypothetical protein